jgi:hypothetical protein
MVAVPTQRPFKRVDNHGAIRIRHKEGFHDQRIGTTSSAVLRLLATFVVTMEASSVMLAPRHKSIHSIHPGLRTFPLYRGASHNIEASKPFFDFVLK